MICTIFNTLHQQTYAGIGNRGGISRERFFAYAFLGSTLWYFFPGYIFQALSYFSWVCWIAPNNVPVNQMFGYVHGMGMSLITFDWAQVRSVWGVFKCLNDGTLDCLHRITPRYSLVGRGQRYGWLRVLLL